MQTSGLVLCICAGLLLSGGAILGSFTAWGLVRMSYYFWTTELGVELATSVVLMAGALLCLPTCWLATQVPYRAKCTELTAALIVLATASMLLLSVGMSSTTSLARALREPLALNASMMCAMSSAGYDPAVRSAFSAMQIELKCCGVQSSSDWYKFRSSLPPACCGRVWNGKTDRCTSSAFTMGCLRPALCELKYFATSVTVLAAAIVIVMAVTIFAAAYALVSEVVGRSELRAKLLSPAVYVSSASPPVSQSLQSNPRVSFPITQV